MDTEQFEWPASAPKGARIADLWAKLGKATAQAVAEALARTKAEGEILRLRAELVEATAIAIAQTKALDAARAPQQAVVEKCSCTKCNGSGVFGHLGACRACDGKGEVPLLGTVSPVRLAKALKQVTGLPPQVCGSSALVQHEDKKWYAPKPEELQEAYRLARQM